MDHKVSIILPTYNGARYISEAIESVIAQTFLDWELVVVDDGSIDSTKEIIDKFLEKEKRIIYFKNESNLGIQKSLNRGLREAKGKYIARIDSDDVWIDFDKLQKQVEFLDSFEDYILVGTGVVNVDEKGVELYRHLQFKEDKEIRERILNKNCFVHSSVMFRKDVALKLGGYSEDEKVKHIEDYDLWLKVGRLGKMANLPFFSVRLLISNNSLSGKNKTDQLKKDLVIINSFKNDYPNYIKAYVLRSIILFCYKNLGLIPEVLKNKIIKIYKLS